MLCDSIETVTVTSETRPASVARVQVVRGGRAGVTKFMQHPAVEGMVIEVVTEIPPERLAGLTAILERRETERITFGSDKPAVGHEADWLTEELGQGERRVGALGAVLTVGKGLSMLAATDPVVAAAVQDALRDGASAYYKYVARNAMTRIIGPEGRQEHVAINSDSLRAVGWLHGHSAAGDPHAHAHIILGTTIHVPGDPRPRAIDTKHFLDEVAQEAEGAARVAMIQTLQQAHGLAIDPLSLDLLGIDAKALKSLDRFSTMRAVVKEAEAHGLSHNAAWKAARQSISRKNDRQPVAEDLHPLTEQIRAWEGQAWTISTPDGDVELRLSHAEALEHALDALSRTPEGQKVVVQWQQDRSGGAFLETIAELERIRLAAQEQSRELDPIEANLTVNDYLARLAQAAEKGQTITRRALRSDAQAIAAAHPELPFAQVNAFLQANFVEVGQRRGLVAVPELAANIEFAEQAMRHLAPAETVQDALTHSVGMTVVQGVAGAGKTTAAMWAARTRWARESGKIWVLSRNAKTAGDLGGAIKAALREAGADDGRVKDMPLARRGWRKPGAVQPGDRIVVDEFALAERNDLALLIELSTMCPVTLLGDTHQQRAITTPTAAQVIAHVAEAAGQPNLEETVRCQKWRGLHDDLRAAVTDEAARERALAALDIRIVASEAEAARIAAREDATLLTLTNELAAKAAASIQHAAGPTIEVRHGVEIAQGEQVVFRAIVRDEDDRILGLTGEVATIVTVTGAGVLLRREGRQELDLLSLEQAREHLAPAVASTIDAAQGRTVERAAVLLTGTEDAHALYSAATRGREAPVILVLQEQEQDEHSRGAEQEHPDPREVVRQVLENSDRGTFLGLAEDDRQALVDKLHEKGHHAVADRLERIEAELAHWRRVQEWVREQDRTPEPEPVQERPQEPVQERQREPARQREPEAVQEQEHPQEPERRPEPVRQREPEPAQERAQERPERPQDHEQDQERPQERKQEQGQELDPAERRRREIERAKREAERQFDEMERRLRQQRQRRERRQEQDDDIPLMPGYDIGSPGGGGWGLGL